MNPSKRAAIKTFTEKLVKALPLESPMTLEKLTDFIDLIGGTYEESDLSQYDGAAGLIQKLSGDPGGKKFKITIKNSDPQGRKVFTIAHELGHLFLHMHYLDQEGWDSNSEYIDSVYYRVGFSEEENEAHEFAANLLMPEDEFKQEFIKENHDMEAVARHFNVSIEAAQTRGKWLALIPWDE